MWQWHAQSLLFACPDCNFPIAISHISEQNNWEEVDEDIVIIKCIFWSLLEQTAKALEDHEDEVNVPQIDGDESTLFELRTHPEDTGKVIGREGRTTKAMRILLGAAAMKLQKRFTLEIVAERSSFRGVPVGRGTRLY